MATNGKDSARGNGKDSARLRAQLPDAICVWCKKRFDRPGDRKVHVSLLGAPGQFHPACFEEYQESATT
ncbi:MAG: hypothetical protein QOJ09_157 [Actinomycetota bacterium]|nr:hypothetical protein [Actinomycetota bacterium]